MHEPTAPVRERTGGAVRASRTAGRLGRELLIAVAAGVFLAFTGAFGSGDAPWPARFAYWLIVMLAGELIGYGVSRVVIGRGWLDRSDWLQGALMTAMIAVPFSVVPWALSGVFFGSRSSPGDIVWFLGPVTAVTAVMVSLGYLTGRQPAVTHAPEGMGATAPPPVRFLERLPPKLRGAAVYAVEAEDHYLRLHTSQGSHLILLRLADAIAELEGIEGAQTHRSWWVARDAVQDARRGDGRATLMLPGGVEAPVSRTYAKALREAGWF